MDGRFDSIKGLGGALCNGRFNSNMPTEKLISYFSDQLDLNIVEFNKSLQLSEVVF